MATDLISVSQDELTNVLSRAVVDVHCRDELNNNLLLFVCTFCHIKGISNFLKGIHSYFYKGTEIRLRTKELVKILVDLGSDIETKDKRDRTPLILAVINGHFEIVKYLLDLGANIEAKDEDGCNSLMHAAKTNHLNILHYLITCVERLDIVEILIEAGADLEIKDKTRYTALKCSAIECELNILKYILDSGANTETKDLEGYTPLLYASLHGHFKAAKILIDYGADVNAKNMHGFTPLTYAILLDKSDMVKYLLDSGADPGIKDNDGVSSLSWAVRKQFFDIAKIIIQHTLLVNSEYSDKPIDINENLLRFWNECKDQVDRMHCHRIGNDDSRLSMHRLLTTCNINTLAGYISNPNTGVVEELSQGDYVNTYPSYAAEIKDKVRKGQRRAFLLNGSCLIFSMSSLVGLPTEIWWAIANLLSNDELEKLWN